MNLHHQIFSLLLILVLALPQPIKADLGTGEKIALGLVGTTVVAIISYALYEGFRERTDTEVLQSTETLCVNAQNTCTNNQLAYDKAFALLQAEQATVELKNYIYSSQCGNRYPILNYIHSLDKVVGDLKYYLESLRNSNATLIQRKLRLLNASNYPKMNNDERAYLVDTYSTQQTKVQEIETLLLKAQQNFTLLKQNISSLPEYAQECLFARLDQLENKLSALELRPQIHTVYVNNSWRQEHRIDHLENRVDQLSSGCYQR